MNWKTPFARDSALWQIMFYGGLVVQAIVTAIALDPAGPAAYGLSPVALKWLGLVNPVILGLGGKQGMSWAQLRRNQDRDPMN